MTTILMTGFPGFLGSQLLPRVLQQAAANRAVCLVQRDFTERAQQRLEAMEAKQPQLRGRTSLVEGDITRRDMGLEHVPQLAKAIDEIFHLAAIYDLAVERGRAMRVNLTGTQRVLDFAAQCPRLRRLHYVSTCYVSGCFPGTFTEEDLERGQSFNNFYEESKYLAEVEVQGRLQEGMPVTIYRPAIVVGDRRTGTTQKYDGPYFVIRWLLRQPPVAIMPVVARSAATHVNIVPSDFVIDAMAYLSGLNQSAGKVYHLADPEPLTVQELLTILAQAAGRTILRVPLPYRVARFAIDHVPGVYRLMKIPSPAIDYFVHPTEYCCRNALRDLEESGIRVPAFPTYVDRLVEYVRAHPEVGSRPMA